MIISNRAAVQRIAQIYQEQRKARQIEKGAGRLSFDDEVKLSTESKEIQAMLQKLQEAPDIRQHAEEIKSAVYDGSYEISTEQIARKILESWGRG